MTMTRIRKDVRRGLVVFLALSYATNTVATEGTCFDGRCSDSPTYVSMMGLGCEEHGIFDCAMFVGMPGFTRQQVDDLIESCPCSCGIECRSKPAEQGELITTPSPSARPTPSPVSPSPTNRPSAAPVSQSPTNAPTLAPTAPPTSAPIKASPTARPPESHNEFSSDALVLMLTLPVIAM